MTLKVDGSELAQGTYQAQALLGDTPGAALTVGGGGAVGAYTPLATLKPYTGYIFKLSK